MKSITKLRTKPFSEEHLNRGGYTPAPPEVVRAAFKAKPIYYEIFKLATAFRRKLRDKPRLATLASQVRPLVEHGYEVEKLFAELDHKFKICRYVTAEGTKCRESRVDWLVANLPEIMDGSQTEWLRPWYNTVVDQLSVRALFVEFRLQKGEVDLLKKHLGVEILTPQNVREWTKDALRASLDVLKAERGLL